MGQVLDQKRTSPTSLHGRVIQKRHENPFRIVENSRNRISESPPSAIHGVERSASFSTIYRPKFSSEHFQNREIQQKRNLLLKKIRKIVENLTQT